MISLLYRLADRLRRRARGTSALAQGRYGEDLAHRYLQRHGCTVVARNFRPHGSGGEIDLVAWDGPALVFVEVKTRASGEYGTPDRAVDADKQWFVQRAAEEYARRVNVDWSCVRFDIIAITLESPPRLEWLQDAFRLTVRPAGPTIVI